MTSWLGALNRGLCNRKDAEPSVFPPPFRSGAAGFPTNCPAGGRAPDIESEPAGAPAQRGRGHGGRAAGLARRPPSARPGRMPGRAAPGPRQPRPRRCGGCVELGFYKTCRTALCATDPPMVLTHIPLLKVPAGAVNVHGHLHRAAGPTDQHINVSVEHTDYAPVGLTYVLELARRHPEPERRHATQARRARDRPPGHVYFSALGVTCQLRCASVPLPLDILSPCGSGRQAVRSGRPGRRRALGRASQALRNGLSRPNRLASCGFPVDFEALSAHRSPGRERWSVTGPLSAPSPRSRQPCAWRVCRWPPTVSAGSAAARR